MTITLIWLLNNQERQQLFLTSHSFNLKLYKGSSTNFFPCWPIPPVTGKLKEHFVFIVDNGRVEAPSSPVVAMWLVRLARILGLKYIAQKSFAEGHSKRNPVERVHAIHNSALSNEVFSSHSVHEKHEIGDAKHHENMEFAVEEVSKCLRHTSFGGKPCVIMRGTGRSKVLPFNDEENLSRFLGKTTKKRRR